MIQRALSRAGTSWKTFIFAALLLCVGVVGGTAAIFTAQVTNKTSTFGGGWVGSPTNAAAAGPQGAEMTVTWSTPTTTGVQGYEVLGTNMGATATPCPASTVTYPVTVTTLAAPASSYTATNAASLADDGDYYCYQVRSYWTLFSWFGDDASNAGTNATRIGFWPVSVTLGTNNNSIGRNDTIRIVFNQTVTLGSTTVELCTSARTLRIGTNSCTGTPTVGILSETGATMAGGNTAYSTSISGSGTTTVTITLSTNHNSGLTGTPSWTYTPSSSLLSSTPAATEAPQCTQSQCVLTPSGNF